MYPYELELTCEMRRRFPRNSGKQQMLFLDELHLMVSVNDKGWTDLAGGGSSV